MPETQGLRSFDPYRTLQLHPAAPRDLIEKAYWLLVSSARASRDTRSTIEEFNLAYAMLNDDAARRAYHDAHGGVPRPIAPARVRLLRLPLFSTAKPAPAGDYYRALCIDTEADSRIVRLAYEFWSHGVLGTRIGRQHIEEAYRTLSNPQLRAQYDARRDAAAPPHGKSKITIQVPDQIQIALHNENTGASEVPDEPLSVPAQPVPSPNIAVSVERIRREESHSPAPLARQEERVAALASIGAPLATEPPLVASRPSVGPAPRDSEVPEAHPDPAPSTDAHARHQPPPARLRGGRQLAEAQQDRLLQLREDAEPASDPPPVFVPPAAKPPAAAAALSFVNGPRAGERIELTDDVIMLGSGPGCEIVLDRAGTNVDPEHASLVRHGETYMFRDLAGHDTTIGDCPLTMPLAILESGDEIQIGGHRMRFTGAGEASSPGDTKPGAMLG